MKLRFAALLSALCLAQTAAANPVVIAHRGASGYVVEHTAAAVALAHALGADFIEQDVQLTKDSAPVIIHDTFIENISDIAAKFPGRAARDGHYYAADFTLAELRTLRLTERGTAVPGQVSGGRFPHGQGRFTVQTLDEEIELVQGLNQTRGLNTGIYVEIKSPARHRKRGLDPSAVVLQVLSKYGYDKPGAPPCWLQCFDRDECKRLRNELGWRGNLLLLLSPKKDKKTGAILQPADADLREIATYANGIGPSLSLLLAPNADGRLADTGLAARARKAGLIVHPSTVQRDRLPEGAASTDALLGLLFNTAAVDGVFTDFPDLVAGWLRAREKNRPANASQTP
ncbi:MAG: glycerophosphodiester phosphodiesterase [Opitutaceae bacterium]|jgi:glycerophosphoryl diester phosphodiesterase|nr:glycerophosphodiester phosphodiesterase [Opitutaceae bacterium]